MIINMKAFGPNREIKQTFFKLTLTYCLRTEENFSIGPIQYLMDFRRTFPSIDVAKQTFMKIVCSVLVE